MEMQEGRSTDLTYELLKGAIDVHVHPGPHIKSSPRLSDPIQTAIEARDAGMRALVYLDVSQMTNGITWLVNRHVPDFQVFGGLILNSVYDGMNPRAVKTAIHYGDGAKYIQFGTHCSHYQASREGRYIDGKYVLLKDLYPKFRKEELARSIRIPVDEKPDQKLDEILKLIAENPHMYIDTGHISPEEAVRLVDLKKKYGYEKVVVSSSVAKVAGIDQLKYMVNKGALVEFTYAAYAAGVVIPGTHYYIEPEYMSIDEGMTDTPTGGIRQVYDLITAIGPENCVLGTDLGRYTMATPLAGMREFIACLLDMGITPQDIRIMTRRNPEWLLGLEPQESQSE